MLVSSAIRLWIPMTRPCMSKSGPPESPIEIVQSVRITVGSTVMTRPNRTGGVRPG
jgi:hypothetical protein